MDERAPRWVVAGLGIGALCIGLWGFSLYHSLIHDALLLWRNGSYTAIKVLVPFAFTGVVATTCGALATLLAWFGRSTGLPVAVLGTLAAVPHALLIVLLLNARIAA